LADIGKQTWFVQEILPHEAVLRGYLGRFLSEPSDIEDGLQETYARLLTLSEEERNRIRSPHAFLFTTARNVALDRLRKQRVVSLEVMAELDELNVIDERPGAYEELNARQELTLLQQALASLPERCRQVLTLRKVYGLPQKVIAAKLNISENTVESHVANGMRLCAARLLELTHAQAGSAANKGGATRRNPNAE
jgi:RNA polymerase sigma factor (sigma-70 family)